jgi:hypothetical protein
MAGDDPDRRRFWKDRDEIREVYVSMPEIQIIKESGSESLEVSGMDSEKIYIQ